jgi:hypothetical protein
MVDALTEPAYCMRDGSLARVVEYPMRTPFCFPACSRRAKVQTHERTYEMRLMSIERHYQYQRPFPIFIDLAHLVVAADSLSLLLSCLFRRTSTFTSPAGSHMGYSATPSSPEASLEASPLRNSDILGPSSVLDRSSSVHKKRRNALACVVSPRSRLFALCCHSTFERRLVDAFRLYLSTTAMEVSKATMGHGS